MTQSERDLEELAARARAQASDEVTILDPRTRRRSAPRPFMPSPALAWGAGVGAPASYVLAWIFNTYLFRGSMPPDVASAFGAALAAGIGYLIQRLSPGESS